MRHIHDDPGFVQSFDQIAAEVAQAAVRGFGAAVTDEITAVVGQVHQPHSDPPPVVDARQFLFQVLEFARKRRTVHTPHNGGFAFAVDRLDLLRRTRLFDHVPEGAQQLEIARHAPDIFRAGFPFGDGLHHALQTGCFHRIAEPFAAFSVAAAFVIHREFEPFFQFALADVFGFEFIPQQHHIVIPGVVRQETEMVHHKEVAVQFQSVFELGCRWIQKFQRGIPRLFLVR